jgi:hypothetical protein
MSFKPQSFLSCFTHKLRLQLLNWRLSDTTAELQLTNAYKAQQEALLYRTQTEIISLQTQLGLYKPALTPTNRRLARSGT